MTVCLRDAASSCWCPLHRISEVISTILCPIVRLAFGDADFLHQTRSLTSINTPPFDERGMSLVAKCIVMLMPCSYLVAEIKMATEKSVEFLFHFGASIGWLSCYRKSPSDLPFFLNSGCASVTYSPLNTARMVYCLGSECVYVDAPRRRFWGQFLYELIPQSMSLYEALKGRKSVVFTKCKCMPVDISWQSKFEFAGCFGCKERVWHSKLRMTGQLIYIALTIQSRVQALAQASLECHCPDDDYSTSCSYFMQTSNDVSFVSLQGLKFFDLITFANVLNLNEFPCDFRTVAPGQKVSVDLAWGLCHIS
uniref:Predicted protein n=1 Tax=Physcomitrium patens TaxID=3218 RepID=A9U4Z7_PHYPA